MPYHNLQELVDANPDLVEYFANETTAPHSRTSASLSAPFVPNEFSNWRDEQRAWRESVALFDQSHHMPELFISGPDARAVLERVAINSLANLAPDRAKQFVACAPDGKVIGDSILYDLGGERYELVSGMTVLEWVEFQALIGGDDVEIVRDASSPFNSTGRTNFRYQIDGPFASDVLAAAVDGELPEIPFFRTARVTIAGRPVLVLRHGMAGHHGAELSGAFADGDAVRDRLLEVGAAHGIVRGGTRAYFSSIYESGWMAYPLPAIYTGEDRRGFREWLPGDGWQARTVIAGSFRGASIEEYYMDPWQLGYGALLKFDHDFIGKEALRAALDLPHRSRVTLVWDHADVQKILMSQFGPGPRFKSLDLPIADYGFPQTDEVRNTAGQLVGISSHCGYSNNEGELLSLATLDASAATPGTEVEILWGEPGGRSPKSHVEQHEQTTVRATVAPVPYSSAVRQFKRETIGRAR